MKTLLLTLSLLLAKPIKQHSVTLTWTDFINPSTTTYNIYKSNSRCSPTTTYFKINSSPIISKTYMDNTVVGGSSYCYSVASFLDGSESEKTGGVTAVVPKP